MKNLFYLASIIILVSCSQEDVDVQPNSKRLLAVEQLTFRIESIDDLPQNSYALAIIDKDDKFEQATIFKSKLVEGSATVEAGDIFEVRIGNTDSRISLAGKLFNVYLTYKGHTYEYKKVGQSKDCSCIAAHEIK